MSIDTTIQVRSFAGRFAKTAVLLLFVLLFVRSSSQTPGSREYNIKAVFLYNFTRFVQWPPDVFENTDSPFIIGILGADPFGPILDQTVEGEKINGHSIVIKRFHSMEQLDKCHILFITSSFPGNFEEIVHELVNRNILTVSDRPSFATKGGMIGFVARDNKTRLQINPSAAKKQNIVISSKLLRLAEIVGESK